MIPILLNARLTVNSGGYIRKLRLEFTDACDSVVLCPGMTRTEIGEALRELTGRVEHHLETGTLSGHD